MYASCIFAFCGLNLLNNTDFGSNHSSNFNNDVTEFSEGSKLNFDFVESRNFEYRMNSSRSIRQTESEICGKPAFEGDPLIMGGTEAQSNDWPWLVAFYFKPKLLNAKYICGATLVSNEHVVS